MLSIEPEQIAEIEVSRDRVYAEQLALWLRRNAEQAFEHESDEALITLIMKALRAARAIGVHDSNTLARYAAVVATIGAAALHCEPLNELLRIPGGNPAGRLEYFLLELRANLVPLAGA